MSLFFYGRILRSMHTPSVYGQIIKMAMRCKLQNSPMHREFPEQSPSGST